MSTTINGITYTASGGTASVTNSIFTITNANILSSVAINGFIYTVTNIGSSAFKERNSLTSVTIPNSVTNIGTDAFRNSRSLNSANLGNSIVSIENSAFDNCRALTSINIPDSVTSVGVFTFRECISLNSVTMGNSIVSMDGQVFSGCTSLTSIIIPNSVISIGNNAFLFCTSLTSVIIGNSLRNIDQSVFKQCTSLTSIIIPNSVTSIENEAFFNCRALTSITIPETVTSIGTGAFSNCSALTSITVPNSITNIENSAFFSCISLTSITIPNSVTRIGTGAFSNCRALTSITVANSITNIENSAFFSCISLTSITIPNSVTRIGTSAFANCPNLITVIVENSTLITSVNSNSFTNVSSKPNSSITFNNTSSFNDLSTTWKNISTYYATVIPPPVVPPTIGPLTIPDKNFGDAPFQIVQPNSNSNGAFSYTSSNTSVATIFNNIITICNAGTSTITANQAASGNYSSGSVYTTFLVNTANPTIGSLIIPDKTFGNAPFQIVQPSSNSDGAFSYTSSDINVATIIGDIITIHNAGTSTITANQAASGNYSSGSVYTTFLVNTANPTIGSLIIPDKTFGNAPFQIVQPSSNSDGAFSYTSSDINVATIIGDIITIHNAGVSLITANQAASGNYSSGSVSTTFTVNPNTPENPADIMNSFEFNYFLNTTATYGNLENSVTINDDLIGFVPKVLTSTNYITIIKM